MSNASQQQNSLLTGKLTGKIAKLGANVATPPSLNAVAMGLFSEFPCEKYQGILLAEQGNCDPITGK
jgi:hypothetical protein